MLVLHGLRGERRGGARPALGGHTARDLNREQRYFVRDRGLLVVGLLDHVQGNAFEIEIYLCRRSVRTRYRANSHRV